MAHHIGYARAIHRILDIVTSDAFYDEYVRLPDSDAPVPDEIRNDPSFWPFFEDCLGAIDGTHILAFLLEEDSIRGRNRKGGVFYTF